MSWARRVVAVVAFVSMARDAKAAGPESLPLDLTWDVPSTCPQRSFVERRVAELIEGRRPARTSAQATVRVAGTAGRFALVLTVRSANGEDRRTIDASSCSALAEASAVVIALAMAPPEDEPSSADAPPMVTVDDAADAAPPVDAVKPPETTPPSSRRRSLEEAASIHFGLGLGPMLGVGVLPALGAGLGASATLHARNVRLGLLGTLWLRQRPTFGPGAGATFDMAELGAFACYAPTLRRFAVGPCASFEATLVRVEGFGIRAPRASWSRWPTAGAGARGEMRVSRWFAAYARADVLFPIGAPVFTLGSSDLVLHRPSLVAARLGLGVEFILP